ncbi:MAG: phage minor capsid protein, partial [Dysgonamonadaceae bacterium]|nr:phage minor capsid protein [Dysgonamonadaceae bacterium]
MKDILQAIDKAPSQFEASIPAVEKKIFREISLILKELKTTSGGKIEPSIDNLKLVSEIKGKLGKIVTGKEYKALVEKFVSNFPAITNYQTSTEGLPAAGKKMLTAAAKMQIDATLENLIGAGYKQTVTDAVAKMLVTSVTSGASYNDMLETLQTTLQGTEEKPGILSNYAKTYVNDTLGQFAGQGNKIVATALKSEWFQYVGSNLTTTREFCEHLTKKRYVHISEIPTILKGEIDGHQCKINPATGLWLGAKDGTDENNFIENRGGWNCGHELIPVNEVSVPQSIRAKFESNYFSKK